MPFLPLMHYSSLGENYAGFRYDGPLLLGNTVLMNVNVIAVSIKTAIKHKRCVHEAARINQASSLTNLHFFNIEDKAAIEDVES